MSIYYFIREDGFYLVDYPDDDSAKVGAFENLGTKQVVSLLSRKIIWDTGEASNILDLSERPPALEPKEARE